MLFMEDMWGNWVEQFQSSVKLFLADVNHTMKWQLFIVNMNFICIAKWEITCVVLELTEQD